MNVFLPMMPRFANAILCGEKTVEFRRTRFRYPPDCAIVYATAPVSNVMGFFSIKEIEYDDPQSIWKKFKDHGGISQREFLEYFAGTGMGCAIQVEDTVCFDNPFPPCLYSERFIIPQSFRYLGEQGFQDMLQIGQRWRTGSYTSSP